jgi:hypothetical protein
VLAVLNRSDASFPLPLQLAAIQLFRLLSTLTTDTSCLFVPSVWGRVGEELSSVIGWRMERTFPSRVMTTLSPLGSGFLTSEVLKSASSVSIGTSVQRIGTNRWLT